MFSVGFDPCGAADLINWNYMEARCEVYTVFVYWYVCEREGCLTVGMDGKAESWTVGETAVLTCCCSRGESSVP